MWPFTTAASSTTTTTTASPTASLASTLATTFRAMTTKATTTTTNAKTTINGTTTTSTTTLTILVYALVLIAQPQSSLWHATATATSTASAATNTAAASGLSAVMSDDDSCNEYVCGSVVSKCLLTQSCQCKLSDCHCCRECLHCLGDLYTECCACLDMCPKHNDSFSALQPKSQIGEFDGVPELFETLTADEDEEQWTIIRFPIRANLKRRFDVPGSSGAAAGDALDRLASRQKVPAVNCTVTYLNACTTNKKCAQYCESMGASSYRWFHDGCCECVGANCFNYGINESRCLSCPEEEDDEEGGEDGGDYGGGANGDDEMWDYGEDEINYN